MLVSLIYITASIGLIKLGCYTIEKMIHIPQYPLWDVIHYNTDGYYWKKYVFTLDLILVAILLSSSVDIIVSKGVYVFINGIVHLITLHWIRCLAVYVTRIPTPALAPRTLISSHMGDIIVSGHAMTAMYATIHTTGFIYYVNLLSTMIMSSLCILSREHYTADVIIGLALGYAW